MLENLTNLQKMFGAMVLGLAGYWLIAIAYELYLRFTVKCVNCIVQDPARLRFYKRLSIALAVFMGIMTVIFLFMDLYVTFVTFVLSLYFFRISILARGRYQKLLEEEGTGYNPNTTFSQDIKDTLSQFKLLFTKPADFFRQNR